MFTRLIQCTLVKGYAWGEVLGPKRQQHDRKCTATHRTYRGEVSILLHLFEKHIQFNLNAQDCGEHCG